MPLPVQRTMPVLLKGLRSTLRWLSAHGDITVRVPQRQWGVGAGAGMGAGHWPFSSAMGFCCCVWRCFWCAFFVGVAKGVVVRGVAVGLDACNRLGQVSHTQTIRSRPPVANRPPATAAPAPVVGVGEIAMQLMGQSRFPMSVATSWGAEAYAARCTAAVRAAAASSFASAAFICASVAAFPEKGVLVLELKRAAIDA